MSIRLCRNPLSPAGSSCRYMFSTRSTHSAWVQQAYGGWNAGIAPSLESRSRNA